MYVSEKKLGEEMDTSSSEQPEMENSEQDCCNSKKCLDEIFEKHNKASLGSRDETREDPVNFRHLLWKAMASFPEVAEQKSRDVVPLFIRFVR